MLQLQRASAGSGKTEQLARHYLQIFFRGDGINVDPATILAATFTREAAGEILARVFRIIARACNEEAVRQTLVSDAGLSPPSREACCILLRRLVDHVDRLAVGTIDALFARQARSLALDLGLASPWEIADTLTGDELARETVVRLLEKNPDVRHAWSGLHHSTRQLSFVEKGAQLLEKNRRVAHAKPLYSVVKDASPPKMISKSQAQETLQFLEIFPMPLNSKGKPDGRWMTALGKLRHAFAQSLALKDLLDLGALVANCLDEEPAFFSKPLPEEFVAYFLPLAEASVQERQRLELLREESLQTIVREYDSLRQAMAFHAGSYTFSEIEEAVQAEHHQLSREEIEFRMEARTEHLLLDEYQDTSQRQHDFLSPLVGDVLAKGGEVFVVGDVKQGIYGWRGGKRHLLGLLAQEHEIHNKEIVSLNKSYRSSQAVLAAVNEVFGALKNRETLATMNAGESFQCASERWRDDFELHEPAPLVASLRGRVALHSIVTAIDEEDPMTVVVNKVISLVEEHQREDPQREIAILVRRTKFIPQLLQGLQAHGILASGEGGNSLTDTLAVEVLLSLLSWMDHPGHTAAYDHVLHSPLKNILEMKGGLLRAELLEAGYAKSLRRWSSQETFQKACSIYERGRLEQLLAMAERFDAAGGGTASDFVKRVRKERVESPMSTGVRVLSIHAAKGLEFEAVILMDLDTDVTGSGHMGLKVQLTEEGNFFIQSNRETMALQGREALLAALSEEQWSEALSLLYVGMTRAASYLDLVIFEECRRKKTMAQWLRSVGLQRHEVDGLSWRSLQREKETKSLLKPSWNQPLRSRQKLSQRSPSHEKEGGLVSVAQQLQGSAARERGTMIHAMLAEVVWSEVLPTVEEIVARLKNRFEVQEIREIAASLLSWIHAATTVFQEEAFLKRWKNLGVTRLDVWRERRFAVVRKTSQEFLSGAFDRVVVGLNAGGVPLIAEIIDFKTDQITTEQQAERDRLYQPQLEAYREALQQLLPTVMTIETRLIWVTL